MIFKTSLGSYLAIYEEGEKTSGSNSVLEKIEMRS